MNSSLLQMMNPLATAQSSGTHAVYFIEHLIQTTVKVAAVRIAEKKYK